MREWSWAPKVFRISIAILIFVDDEFCLEAKLTKEGVVFSCKLWLVNVEVTAKHGRKEISQIKFSEDFSYDKKLQLNVKKRLEIGDFVSIELILMLKLQEPMLIVPVDKVSC